MKSSNQLQPQIVNPEKRETKKLSYSLPAYLTNTVKLLELISPKLVLPLALKLFFTPLKFKTPLREKKIIENGAIKHKLTTTNREFTAYEWKGDGPRILMVHGWSGRGTQFFKIIDQLRNKGYHILTIDAPAHGDSTQKKTHLFEFVDAIEVVVSRFGHFETAIGHSLGGMAIFNALTRNLLSKNIVIIGSPASIKNVVFDFCEKIGASSKVGLGIIKYIENRYSMDTDDISSDHLTRKYNPRGLIIHDLDDLDVDVDNARELNESWPNSKLILTEGFGHRKILMEQKVLDFIDEFISTN